MQQPADHLVPISLTRLPGHLLALAVVLAQRYRRDAEQCRLHRRRDGTGIGQILADIAAAIDPGQHEIGRFVAQQALDGEQDAIGRRAVAPITPRGDLGEAQRPARRQRVAGAALLLLRRDDPDIVRQLARDFLQNLDTRRPDPVIIRYQDPAFVPVDRFSHPLRSPSVRPYRVATLQGSRQCRWPAESSRGSRSTFGRLRARSRSAYATAALPSRLPGDSAPSSAGPGKDRNSSSWKSRDRCSGPASRLRDRRSCAPQTPYRRSTAA